MKALQPRARVWNEEMSSLSPIEEVERMDDTAQVWIIHGNNDEIVPLNITNSYAQELEVHNKKVEFIILENQGHEIALGQKVFDVVKELID